VVILSQEETTVRLVKGSCHEKSRNRDKIKMRECVVVIPGDLQGGHWCIVILAVYQAILPLIVLM
jgi:hypothetical protein